MQYFIYIYTYVFLWNIHYSCRCVKLHLHVGSASRGKPLTFERGECHEGMENLLLMEEIPNNHLGIMSNRQIMGYFHIFSISTGECRISEPSTVLGGCFKYAFFADWSPQMMVCSQNLEKT